MEGLRWALQGFLLVAAQRVVTSPQVSPES